MSSVITPVKIWRRKKKTSDLIGKTGVVESFTIVRVAPTGFSQYVPYPVAIVKLTGGRRLIGQMTDYTDSDLVLGRKITVVLRRSRTEGKKDVIDYVLKFKPL